MGALISFNSQRWHSRHAAFGDVRFRGKRTWGRYVIEAGVRFSELFFGIDLHQSQAAKNDMSALH
jgi:hypothetical protein